MAKQAENLDLIVLNGSARQHADAAEMMATAWRTWLKHEQEKEEWAQRVVTKWFRPVLECVDGMWYYRLSFLAWRRS